MWVLSYYLILYILRIFIWTNLDRKVYTIVHSNSCYLFFLILHDDLKKPSKVVSSVFYQTKSKLSGYFVSHLLSITWKVHELNVFSAWILYILVTQEITLTSSCDRPTTNWSQDINYYRKKIPTHVSVLHLLDTVCVCAYVCEYMCVKNNVNMYIWE